MTDSAMMPTVRMRIHHDSPEPIKARVIEYPGLGRSTASIDGTLGAFQPRTSVQDAEMDADAFLKKRGHDCEQMGCHPWFTPDDLIDK